MSYTTLCVHVPPLLKLRFLKKSRERGLSCRRLILELPVSDRTVYFRGLVRLCVRLKRDEYCALKAQATSYSITLSELIRRKLLSID